MSQLELMQHLHDVEKWLIDERYPQPEGQPLFSATDAGFYMLTARISNLVADVCGAEWNELKQTEEI